MTPALTPEQVAERWQCSARHVRNRLNSGELRGFKVGGKLWRTRSEWVEEFEQCRNGAEDDTAASSSPSEDTETAARDIRLARIERKLTGSSTG